MPSAIPSSPWNSVDGSPAWYRRVSPAQYKVVFLRRHGGGGVDLALSRVRLPPIPLADGSVLDAVADEGVDPADVLADPGLAAVALAVHAGPDLSWRFLDRISAKSEACARWGVPA